MKHPECNDRELLADTKQFNDLSNETETTQLSGDKISGKNYINSDEQDRVIREFFKQLNVNLPADWEEIRDEERRKLICKWTSEGFPNIPKSLLKITTGWMVHGDCGRPADQVPDWLDREKFRRGQKFARDNMFGIYFSQLLTLFGLFSFEDGLKPMIVTGKSSEPYTAFKRYLSTGARVRNWFTSDPWTKGTSAYNDIQTVRRMHTIVRNKLSSISNEEIDKAGKIESPWSPTRNILLQDFRAECPVAKSGQCPFAAGTVRAVRPKGLHQGEMAVTQGGFVCLAVVYPEAFGLHGATDQDLDDFCHVWRGIGYLLGIEDEFNYCGGTLEEIKQLSADYLNQWVKPNLRDITPEWEHMMRCITVGMQYYFPGSSYEVSLLYLTELLNLDMPLLRSSLSYRDRFKFNITKFTMYYATRSPRVKEFLNSRLNKSIDRALKFTEEKHSELRKKSSKTLSVIQKNNNNNNINNINNKKDEKYLDVSIFSQYKIIGLVMLCVQCLIMWKVKFLSEIF
ncbi:GSCOCG00003575001-RA-CDS [Cotesia congregata]|uniref:ER-bound oxygenase mpaB/mpaB'/Rubber oxygenase catalytic domain-containing protein n=1 Tax=Cotesia congregata TaxID=51543 RepID=A0A8J2H655_COTCN|nr:GSCOCG00003575001-RA-CDS [Cotesia congregata]CAG5077778.1 Protein of unknown function [Cotesia congregata]